MVSWHYMVLWYFSWYSIARHFYGIVTTLAYIHTYISDMKTADLTVVQKTIIDTLHKEGKPQTFITKEAVHRVLYPSMLTESWVEGKSVEEKDTQPKNHSIMRIVKQNRFKNLGELHTEWTEAGVKASRAPHTEVSRNLATVVVFLLLSHSW